MVSFISINLKTKYTLFIGFMTTIYNFIILFFQPQCTFTLNFLKFFNTAHPASFFQLTSYFMNIQFLTITSVTTIFPILLCLFFMRDLLSNIGCTCHNNFSLSSTDWYIGGWFAVLVYQMFVYVFLCLLIFFFFVLVATAKKHDFLECYTYSVNWRICWIISKMLYEEIWSNLSGTVL